MNQKISKADILKVMAVSYSELDGLYCASSIAFDRIRGYGYSEAEAKADFQATLNETYQYIEQNKVAGYNKRGRPAKYCVNMHIQVKPETKAFIDQFKAETTLSQGEVIDYLVSIQPKHSALTRYAANSIVQFPGVLGASSLSVTENRSLRIFDDSYLISA